ncbi:MAG TPA: ACP S-malonyltransferase [Verrucomicrobiae bacterium]|jgi:[acyl-carrier-protein] S-malonyltransferase|nr:ACP S-malonyltransferase [Verrucomicrobiae bacterium]
MMQKTALLFAGQGAQCAGMGRDWAAHFPTAKALFDRSEEILGFDLARICLNGPEEELTRTENAQPGIFLTSWVALQLLKERVPDLSFHATAGLSLGELTALAAAGVLGFEDGLKSARQRGLFMQEACEKTHGTMAAVLGLDVTALREVCAAADVDIANLNCPGQIVISGEAEKIAAACELAKAKGAKRAVLLPVAGAYHSRLMAGAQPKVRVMLDALALNPAAVPVISNVTALPHGMPEEIREALTAQVVSPVRWEDSIRYLLAQGFTRFIELGPGSVLSGFVKRIEKTPLSEKGLDKDFLGKWVGESKEVMVKAVEEALLAAAKKAVGPARELRCAVDPKTGDIKVFANLIVSERVLSKHEQISLLDARRIKADAQLGEQLEAEVTPAGFGRTASQYAKQALMQRIRQAEKQIDHEGDIAILNVADMPSLESTVKVLSTNS